MVERRQRRGHASASFGWLTCLGLILFGSAAGAAVPEPDHLFYGRVTEAGEVRTDVLIELRREVGDCPGVLASAVPGSLEGDTDLFLLRVRFEQPESLDEDCRDRVARAGEGAVVYINDVPILMLHVGGRGLAVRLDLDLSATSSGGSGGSPPDGDEDGVPDYADNCFLPNASQQDDNDNGIGDPCEGLVNPATKLATMGEVDNDADPKTSFGNVTYEFDYADTEVTNAQYAEFLGAVAVVADPNALYNEAMASDPRGGIVRGGEWGAYHYRVKPNMANKPVNFVSWLDAARYVNWLENGRPLGLQQDDTTEKGTFDLTVASPARNATLDEEARWSLLTEDEWYKAAYFDPTRNGEPWWRYPTREDVEPVLATANELGDVVNQAQDVANYALAADWNGQDGNVTSVASSTSSSWSGGFDLGGNVAEWLAADAEGDGLRVVRGGSFVDDHVALSSTADAADRNAVLRDPVYEGADVGFRVVAVPEPGTLATGLAVLVLLGAGRRLRAAR